MSNFLERAKRCHARGDVTGAAFMLADGLRRDQRNIEALEWFMHLYVRELSRAGAERELISVLHTQPNGGLLFAKVCARLAEGGDTTRLDALRRESARLGVPADTGVAHGAAAAPPHEADAIPERPPLRTPLPAPAPVEGAAPTEDWEAFASPLDASGSRVALTSERPELRRDPVASIPEPDETVDVDAVSDGVPAVDRSRAILVAVAAAVLLAIAAAFLLIPGQPQGGDAPLEPAIGSGATP